MTSPSLRAARLGAAVLLTLPVLLAGPTSAAEAAACDPLNHVAGDINSDGVSDVVTGVPRIDNKQGGVDVLLSNGTRSFITAVSLGLPASAPGDYFGTAVTTADLNLDGCADLVIGAPERNGTGAIYLAFGTSSGTLVNATIRDAPTGARGFGSSLVVLAPEEWNGTSWVRTHQRVVVGAPQSDVYSHPFAGAIYVFHSAAGDTALTNVAQLTQASLGVPDVPEDGEAFGTTLAGEGRTIVVGTPGESVGTAPDAGSVTLLSSTAADPSTFTGKRITQDTAGVPGYAEEYDQFGGAVALRDGHLVIAAPTENVAGITAAGVVQLVSCASNSL
ncbi:MAG: integrin alpha [Micropruina sp.]